MTDSRSSWSTAGLADRLQKLRAELTSSHTSAMEVSETAIFSYKTMVLEMMASARDHDRNFLEDVLRLIMVYFKYGSNNITKILSEFTDAPELRERLETMRSVYKIGSTGKVFNRWPTLGRISEALPHLSLFIASQPGLMPRFHVTNRDLGASVPFYFKLTFFPGLIIEEGDIQAQARFYLFTLCQTKAILNTSSTRHSVPDTLSPVIKAFLYSCKTSWQVKEHKMAPLESRKQFTKYVKMFPLTAQMMYDIHRNVIGDTIIMANSSTVVTYFHEKVLSEQPLTLNKWAKLLAN